MKGTVATALLGLLLSMPLWASGTHYEMRVDGLACPYCAYGIEKKLTAIEGVQGFAVDLDAGIVRVDVSEGFILEEAAMIKLFNDAGFTYRSMTVSQLESEPSEARQ